MAVLADMLGFSELFGTKYLNGAWWYMSAAAVYILLVPILAELIQRTGGGFSMALVIALPRVLGVKYQGGNAALTFLPVMLLGMICCRYDIFERFHELRITGNKRLDAMIKFIGLTAGVVFGRWSFDKVDAKIFAEYKFMVIPFFVILFCVEFLFHMKYLSLILGFFGKHSMNIWLVHTFVRDWIPQAAYGLKEFWTVPLVILGISLGISYVLMFVKRISGYDAFVEKLIHKIS